MFTRLRQLPASARTLAADNGGWSNSDHLLALIAELTHMTYGAVVATVTTKPGQRLNFPEKFHVPRPGDKKKKPKTSIDALAELVRAVGGG